MDKKEKNPARSSLAVRRIITVILCFFMTVFLLAETYTLLICVIPWVSINMFQATGISVAEGLTFAEFSVGDMIVLFMMWLLPCLCGVALVSAAQWKFICFMVRKMYNMFKASFVRAVSADTNQKS